MKRRGHSPCVVTAEGYVKLEKFEKFEKFVHGITGEKSIGGSGDLMSRDFFCNFLSGVHQIGFGNWSAMRFRLVTMEKQRAQRVYSFAVSAGYRDWHHRRSLLDGFVFSFADGIISRGCQRAIQ